MKCISPRTPPAKPPLDRPPHVSRKRALSMESRFALLAEAEAAEEATVAAAAAARARSQSVAMHVASPRGTHAAAPRVPAGAALPPRHDASRRVPVAATTVQPAPARVVPERAVPERLVPEASTNALEVAPVSRQTIEAQIAARVKDYAELTAANPQTVAAPNPSFNLEVLVDEAFSKILDDEACSELKPKTRSEARELKRSLWHSLPAHSWCEAPRVNQVRIELDSLALMIARLLDARSAFTEEPYALNHPGLARQIQRDSNRFRPTWLCD